jgi:NAD kinase
MNRLTDNKIVLVTRPTRLAELVVRFNTVSQARFYIEHLGADFQDYLREDEMYHHALMDAQAVLARLGRVQSVDRAFLPNFVFGPEDTIVTLGQDGLVANTLKYLNGQPLVGVNPDPARWDGKLLPFKGGDLPKLLPEVFAKGRPIKSVTMAKASLNNGQTMYAVNDLFIGPKSHTSARYIIRSGESTETQSSSGVVVSTGLGSSGWLKSLLTGAAAVTRSAAPMMAGTYVTAVHASRTGTQRTSSIPKKQLGTSSGVTTEIPWNAQHLFFTVREPFPTRTTGASLVFGQVTPETPLTLESQMAENGVIFSDGIEKDFLEFNSGARAVIGLAERQGSLVT